MSDAELKSVAENMGIKKFDLNKKDELIYQILDQQAIDMAANASEKKQRAPKESKPKMAIFFMPKRFTQVPKYSATKTCTT
jgi:hypothetical protein